MTRKRMFWIAVLISAAVIGFVLVVFQPQKLVIDKRVDEARPAAAAPAVAAPAAPVQTGSPSPSSSEAPTAAPAPAATPAPNASSAPTAPAASASVPSTVEATSAAAAAAPAPARGGAFRSLNHPGSGTASLLQVGTSYVVRFEDLKVENGPDLHVYLSTAPSGSKESAFDDDYVSLGRLKGNKGNQNYQIPADVDVSRYKSVVVWCKRFSSGFAVAPLA